MRIISVIISSIAFCCINCGVYTFSGSTLPGHLKTVDIPLFLNESLQADIAEQLTNELTKRVLSENLLRIIQNRGDATISGRIISYENIPYMYGISNKEVTTSQYAVRIVIDAEFKDNIKNKSLYKNIVTGQGLYNITTEKEVDGRTRALSNIIDQILQNSIQSW